MKLLLDTCVSHGAQVELASAGHDVVHTGESEPDPGDEEILAQAHRDNRVLVTLDKDFGELAIVRGHEHWHRHLVESDATNAGDLRVEPRVVVAEKADPRAGAGNRLGEAFRFAPVPAADGAVLASPGELDSGRSIVKEEHVDTAAAFANYQTRRSPSKCSW